MSETSQQDYTVPLNADGTTGSHHLKTGSQFTIVIDRAIETLIIGEDEKPLEGVAISLRRDDDMELLAVSDGKGIARFSKLEKDRKYRFSLYARDKDAWELIESTGAGGDTRAVPTDMEWQSISTAETTRTKKHIVQQGECISSIAEFYGFFPETLWEHKANKDLKEKRKDPNILMSGDEVRVPDLRQKEEAATIGKQYTVKTKGVPERLVIQFVIGGEPRAKEAYLLTVDGVPHKGITDKDGVVDVWVPPKAVHGKLVFLDSGAEYDIRLGYMDPITEISGIQGRLQNLGYYFGPVDGKPNQSLEDGILCFQNEYDLKPTAELNDRTREKILKVHGS